MRSIGPAAATSLFAITIEKNILGGYLVYAIILIIVVLAICAASLLPVHEEDWEDLSDIVEEAIEDERT